MKGPNKYNQKWKRNYNGYLRNTKNHNRLLWTTTNQQTGQHGRMDKFLGLYNLPRVNQEEITNLNRLFISNEIKSVTKSS